MYFAVLRCTSLYFAVLFCTYLYFAVLRCTLLYFAVLRCTSLYFAVLRCTLLYFAVLCCTLLYFAVLCCTSLITIPQLQVVRTIEICDWLTCLDVTRNRSLICAANKRELLRHRSVYVVIASSKRLRYYSVTLNRDILIRVSSPALFKWNINCLIQTHYSISAPIPLSPFTVLYAPPHCSSSTLTAECLLKIYDYYSSTFQDYDCHNGNVVCCRFSSDGSLLVSCSDRQLFIWTVNQ